MKHTARQRWRGGSEWTWPLPLAVSLAGQAPQASGPSWPQRGTVAVTPASQLLCGGCSLKWKIRQNNLQMNPVNERVFAKRIPPRYLNGGS